MTTFVPAQFPDKLPCSIAFVGEGPSDYEMLDLIPFVGPAGKLFNNLLKMANIDREACLVTNVFNTQLPDNKVENWCGTTKEAKAWQKDGYDLPPVGRGKWLRPEYIHHLDRLAQEIETADPTVIVPLGGTALWAFTGFSGITERRGAVHEATMTAPGRKLVPTFHPAFLIHSYKLFPVVTADLMKAKNESRYPEIKTTAREIWVEPTWEDMWTFYARYLENAPYISIDIETPFLKKGIPPRFRQIKCIGFSDGPHHALCIPFVDETKPNNSYWETLDEELSAWDFVRSVCENRTPKLGQNYGAFDAHWIYDVYGIRTVNYCFDTRLEHHALYPELLKDLGTLGALYANETAWKTYRQEKTEKRDE